MNILVTGGAGFIGTNLIKRLVSEGHKVTSIDNYHTGKKENHIAGANYIEYDITKMKDLRDINFYCQTNGDFDLVYHLAAIARIQPSFKKPVEYFETNANGSLYLIDYCSKKNIPIIYAGSSSHHSGKFKNPYTFSKDVGEEIVMLYQKHYNLQCSIARFYNVYGPNHLREGGYCTLIGSWEKRIEEGKKLIIYGDGTKRRDFTHVNDIVDGLMKIFEKKVWGKEFEFGRGQNYSVNEIADMFGFEREYAEDKPGEAQDTLCESELAKELLGWEATKNIEDYIKTYLIK